MSQWTPTPEPAMSSGPERYSVSELIQGNIFLALSLSALKALVCHGHLPTDALKTIQKNVD
jgi:hypothetical protein